MDAKRCPRCGETKPPDGFFRNKARSDGRSVYCRACQQKAAQESLLAWRLRLFELLGGAVCRRCSISDPRVLVFDHKNGGGGLHRRDAVSGYSMYRYIEANPAEFQVLCFNCNHLERIERGESGAAYAARVAAKGPLPSVTKPRRWSRDYDSCQQCGTTERRHHGRGLCFRCTQEKFRRARGSQPRRAGRASERIRWSRLFERCQECGTTETPYGGKGLCRNCYMRRLNDRRRAARQE